MKNAILALVFLCSGRAMAADDYMFHLRVEPHWLLFTEAAVDLQFRLGKHFSAGPTLAYMAEGAGIFTGGKVTNHLYYDDKTQRLTAGLRAAYYFSGVDERSLYVALFASHSKSKVTSTPKSIAASILNDPVRTGEFTETRTAVALGYQWIVQRFTFNVGAGIGLYKHPDTIRLAAANGASAYDFALPKSNVGLVLDAGAGFRF